jgi:hypothetical protein
MKDAERRSALDEITCNSGKAVELQRFGRVTSTYVRELGSRCPQKAIVTVDQCTTGIRSPQDEALQRNVWPRQMDP